MTYLQEHLSTLLEENDCVIIPDFGGFVTNQASARLNRRNNRMQPPSKEVGFNVRLFHNDGLFAQGLRVQQNCSYEKAMTQIRAEVAWLKRQLDSGKQIAFPEVGSLYKDGEGQMVFSPSHTRNYLPDAFGLEQIELYPVGAEVGDEEKPVVSIRVNNTRRLLRNLAGAAAVPVLVAAAWLMQESSQNNSTFSLLPSTESGSAEYAPRFEEEGLRFSAPDTLDFIAYHKALNPDLDILSYSLLEDAVSPDGIRIRLKDEGAETQKTETTEILKPTTNKASNLNLYFVVGGAFKEKSNAEGYVSTLRQKGYDASIFGMKGDLHLVAFGSYSDRSSAMADLARIRQNDNPGAWLKRQ